MTDSLSHVHSSVEFKSVDTYSSGVQRERKIFEWKIQSFDVILKDKELISQQELVVDVGTAANKSKWRFDFIVKDIKPEDKTDHQQIEPKQWIGFYGSLHSHTENVWARFGVQPLVGYTYSNSNQRVTGIRKFLPGSGGWGWPQFIPMDVDTNLLPLTDDNAFVLKIDLEVLINHPKAKLSSESNVLLAETGLQILSQNFKSLLLKDDKELSDLKLISKDGRTYATHRAVLAARSPVFLALVSSKMKESFTGEIAVDDLSGDTIWVLLEYLYTGIISHRWKEPKVIVEFAYAAGKYQLTEILKFLDKSLGVYTTNENAVKLLSLANKLGLEIAETQLKEYILLMLGKTENTDVFLDFLCLPGDEEDAPAKDPEKSDGTIDDADKNTALVNSADYSSVD